MVLIIFFTPSLISLSLSLSISMMCMYWCVRVSVIIAMAWREVIRSRHLHLIWLFSSAILALSAEASMHDAIIAMHATNLHALIYMRTPMATPNITRCKHGRKTRHAEHVYAATPDWPSSKGHGVNVRWPKYLA